MLAPIFVGLTAGSTCSEKAGIFTVIRPLVAPLLAVWGGGGGGGGMCGSLRLGLPTPLAVHRAGECREGKYM